MERKNILLRACALLLKPFYDNFWKSFEVGAFVYLIANVLGILEGSSELYRVQSDLVKDFRVFVAPLLGKGQFQNLAGCHVNQSDFSKVVSNDDNALVKAVNKLDVPALKKVALVDKLTDNPN